MRVDSSLLLALIGATVVTGCGSSSSSGAGGSPAAAASAGASSAGDAGSANRYGYGSSGGAAPAPPAAGALRIAGFAYHPTPLTVPAGQVVSVTNADSAEHTATSDVAGLFKGDDIKQGKTVTFRAPTRPGTYTFHCEYHASMHGTLVVT